MSQINSILVAIVWAVTDKEGKQPKKKLLCQHLFDPFLQTIGELFLVLSEMGFTEEQIQAAMQAGHFSVAEAADWWVISPLFFLFFLICGAS